MRYRSMHNPRYARTVWNTFRDSRPLGRHALARKAPATTTGAEDEAKQLSDALVAEYVRSCRGQQEGTPSENPHQEQGTPIMIKLNTGASRKVGQPNYGSRGASVNVELELESAATQDADVLQDRIRRLFAIARNAVDAELGLTGEAEDTAAGQQPAANGNGTSVRTASEAQKRAINAICTRLGLDPHAESHHRLGRAIQELTLPEALATGRWCDRARRTHAYLIYSKKVI